MPASLRSAVFCLVALPLLTGSTSFAQGVSSVKLIHTATLPGYSGDFDHFAADYDRNRLLLAAEDHGTLEVFDLKTSAHLRTVAGFGNPHSILVRKGVPTVFITDSTDKNASIRDADTYSLKQKVNLTPGSDTAKYDPASNVLYVVTASISATSASMPITSRRWPSSPAILASSSISPKPTKLPSLTARL